VRRFAIKRLRLKDEMSSGDAEVVGGGSEGAITKATDPGVFGNSASRPAVRYDLPPCFLPTTHSLYYFRDTSAREKPKTMTVGGRLCCEQ
jgi:hypothetical protein